MQQAMQQKQSRSSVALHPLFLERGACNRAATVRATRHVIVAQPLQLENEPSLSVDERNTPETKTQKLRLKVDPIHSC